MAKFAKLFEFDGIGQVLVKLDDGDNGAEVRIYFQPEGLGVCSVAFNFEPSETETEADKAERAFALIDQDKAASIVRNTLKTMPAGLAG